LWIKNKEGGRKGGKDETKNLAREKGRNNPSTGWSSEKNLGKRGGKSNEDQYRKLKGYTAQEMRVLGEKGKDTRIEKIAVRR